ncbi:MAG TPA: kelch repeat-containing protein, partial [Bryobacteraceae bacterium]
MTRPTTWRPQLTRIVFWLLAVISPLALADTTCLDFPAAQSIPFASIAYVTAANSAGDHLVVGSLAGGAGALGAINANIPPPAFTNQTFCGQVQFAAGQFYSNVYVPTAAERAGNFSQFAGLLVDPANNQAFPGGIIPPKQLGAVYAWRIGATQVASALQGWSPTGSMSITRSDHAAVLLPSGKVFLVGGSGSSLAELYDPATGTFSSAGRTVVSHGNSVGAILLNDGRVLIEGGAVSPTAAELYDPVAGSFKRLGNLIEGHGAFQSATLLNDGRVLVVGGLTTPGFSGGFANAGAEIFDPIT